MSEILPWIYMINAVFLINHEIDSAFWKEWNLFNIKGGISFFLAIHFPLLFLVLYGAVLVFQHFYLGLLFSLILSISGIFAFVIHSTFIHKGHLEFTTSMSQFILRSTLVLSILQASLTIALIAA